MKKIFPLNKVNSLIQSGPVILLSTFYKGKNNFMPISWHTMLDFNPPLIAAVVGAGSFTHEALLKTGEAVINIPTVEIAKEALLAGKMSGNKIDKFLKTGLTPIKASKVKAPIIKECYANIECRLHDSKMAKKYDLFILKGLKAYCETFIKNPKTFHHISGNSFVLGGKTVKF